MERIVVYEGDTADSLTQKFCEKHNLSDDMKVKLKSLLEQQIAGVLPKIVEDEDISESEHWEINYIITKPTWIQRNSLCSFQCLMFCKSHHARVHGLLRGSEHNHVSGTLLSPEFRGCIVAGNCFSWFVGTKWRVYLRSEINWKWVCEAFCRCWKILRLRSNYHANNHEVCTIKLYKCVFDQSTKTG